LDALLLDLNGHRHTAVFKLFTRDFQSGKYLLQLSPEPLLKLTRTFNAAVQSPVRE
jgi:hypothetical protein